MTPAAPPDPRRAAATRPRLVAAAGVVLLAVVIANAWVGDDAMITLRTVDNFVHGYGLRYNAAERVLTNVHPLWMLVLSPFYALTREPFFTTIAVGTATSALAVVTLVRGAHGRAQAALALFALTWSKAFVDYATSGLENPLSYLLLALAVRTFLRSAPSLATTRTLALYTALGTLTRMDVALVFAPLLGVAMWQARARPPAVLSAALVGLAPLFLWEGFSLVYYGSFLPNTAYAKLGTGTDTAERLAQGVGYFAATLRHDPLTFVAMVAGLLAAARHPDRRQLAVGLGVLAYCGYTLWIGGDHMSGRFFAVPLFAAMTLLVRSQVHLNRAQITWAAATCVALAVVGGSPPVLVERLDEPELDTAVDHGHGVFDERLYYCRWVSLREALRTGRPPNTPHGERGAAQRALGGVRLQAAIGYFGYCAGPGVHVYDLIALADPLLARLPARRDIAQRVGHFLRMQPDGYPQTLATGTDQLASPALRQLWDDLALATRAPLFAPGRWSAIGRLLDPPRLPDAEFETLIRPKPLVYRADEIARAEPSAGVAPPALRVPPSGALLPLQTLARESIELGLSADDFFIVYVLNRQGEFVGGQPFFPMAVGDNSPRTRTLALRARAREGTAGVLVLPVEGDNLASVAWLRTVR